MRVVFMGTPEFAVPSLLALIENGYDVVGVFCQPDKPKGRGKKTEFCPVKACATTHDIPVFQPQKMRLDGAEMLENLAPDVCVTAAFGQILSERNLDVPKFGTINVHASLLPKLRGSAPIHWAVITGEKETGITTMLTDKGMDTGDILLKKVCAIEDDITADALTEKLSFMGAELLLETLDKLKQGTLNRVKQDETQMTYYPMLKKEMGEIDFSLSAQQVKNLVRGVYKWPGAYTFLEGEKVKVHKVSIVQDSSNALPYTILSKDAKDGLVVKTGENAVKIEILQMSGGKSMQATDYLRGHAINNTRFERSEENI